LHSSRDWSRCRVRERRRFEHTAHLQRSLADVRTGVIPEAGHTSNMEHPEAFTAELQAFLDETTDDT